MKILVVIPANIISNELKFSTFIKTEVDQLRKMESIEIEEFFFVMRNNFLGFYRELKRLNKKIRGFQPDIIHSHYGATTGLLVAMSKKSCPWVATFGGSELLGHPNKGIYWRLREAFSKKLSHYSAYKADSLICVSQNLKNKLSKINQSKCTIIPRGVDANFFKPNRDVSFSNKILFSLPRANAVVKNLPLAEKVISIFNEKSEGRILTLDIINNKSQNQIREMFRYGDLLLVTSFHEGSPNIVKEAMSSNIPVVSVDCGDVRFLLEGVSNCFVSNDYDEIELAELVSKIYNGGIRESNGNVILADKGLTVEVCCRKIVSVYKKLL